MLNEFNWAKDEETGKETLDCHIGIEDGQYFIRNHQDSSQTEKFSSPEELGSAVADVLRERSNR